MFNLCTPFNGGLREDVATFMYGVIGRLLPFDQSGWVNTTAMCGTMENVDIGTPLDRLVYYEKIQLQGYEYNFIYYQYSFDCIRDTNYEVKVPYPRNLELYNCPLATL